jgi:chromosome segregation ATPase
MQNDPDITATYEALNARKAALLEDLDELEHKIWRVDKDIDKLDRATRTTLQYMFKRISDYLDRLVT